MIPLKYSCEEIYERMENGLCIFCEEHDTPDHQLKHKRFRIVMIEREDDLACDDVEQVHQIQKAVKNPNPFMEAMKTSDPLIEPLECASSIQVLGSVSDVLIVNKMDLHVKEVEELPQQSTIGNGKIDAHQVFDKIPLRVTSKEKQRKYLKGWKFKFKANSKRQKSMNDKLSSEDKTALLNEDHEQIIWDCVYKEFKETMTAHGKKRVDRFKLSRADRVWEPGSLQVKFDMWDWPEKELKPYGESHQVATFLYFQMQVVKSNPAEFKTSDKKRSNKTLSLEVEQNDEHEQNQVRKLISSWNNQVWEPGGVSNEQDMWKWLDKCYEHSGVMRLMQRMSNTWWSYGKVAELTQRMQQPKTYLKGVKFKELDRAVRFSAVTETWLLICSCEYKIQNLLPCYHSLKVQEMQIFPEDKVEFPEVRLINMHKGLVCDTEKMELRNLKAVGCACDLDKVNSLGKEEFVSFIEFSKRQLAMEFLVNPRLIHIKGISVFVALRVALALLVDLDHNKVRRTHYGKAEKVDKHKYTFIRKFAESIILATIDEHKYIKITYILLRMGLYGGENEFSSLVKVDVMPLLERDKGELSEKQKTYHKTWKFEYIHKSLLRVLLSNDQHKLMGGRNIKCKMRIEVNIETHMVLWVKDRKVTGVTGEYDLHGRLKGDMSFGSLTKKQHSMWGLLTETETFSYNGVIIQIMVQRQWESFVMMLFVIAKSLILLSDPLVFAKKKGIEISISCCYGISSVDVQFSTAFEITAEQQHFIQLSTLPRENSHADADKILQKMEGLVASLAQNKAVTNEMRCLIGIEMFLVECCWMFPTFDGLNANVIDAIVMESFMKSLDELRVVGLHYTSSFLYGSLPRPPEENHSDFRNILQYYKDCWFASDPELGDGVLLPDASYYIELIEFGRDSYQDFITKDQAYHP